MAGILLFLHDMKKTMDFIKTEDSEKSLEKKEVATVDPENKTPDDSENSIAARLPVDACRIFGKGYTPYRLSRN